MFTSKGRHANNLEPVVTALRAIARPGKRNFAVGPVVDRGGEAFGRAALMLPALELPEESDAVVEQLERRYAGVAVCTTSASAR